jgi:hypothetical protein
MGYALAGACQGGQINMIDYIVDKIGKLFITEPLPFWISGRSYLGHACESGDMKTVQHILDQGDKSYNDGFASAAVRGHRDIAEYMIELGATNWSSTFILLAKRWEYPGMIDWIVSLGPVGIDIYNRALVEICGSCTITSSKKKLEAISYMFDHGACSINAALRAACRISNHNVVWILVMCGASDVNSALIHACKWGEPDDVKTMIKCGGTSYNDGLTAACVYDCIDNAKLMVEHGASNFEQVRCKLSKLPLNNVECMAYLTKQINKANAGRM